MKSNYIAPNGILVPKLISRVKNELIGLGILSGLLNCLIALWIGNPEGMRPGTDRLLFSFGVASVILGVIASAVFYYSLQNPRSSNSRTVQLTASNSFDQRRDILGLVLLPHCLIGAIFAAFSFSIGDSIASIVGTLLYLLPYLAYYCHLKLKIDEITSNETRT